MITLDPVTQVSMTAAGLVEYLARDLPLNRPRLFRLVEEAVGRALRLAMSQDEEPDSRSCRECGAPIAADWDEPVCPCCKEWLGNMAATSRHMQETRLNQQTV